MTKAFRAIYFIIVNKHTIILQSEIMNKRKATVSQPPAFRQKQLMQSILQFVPLTEAALSAKVCKSWRNATKDGFKFHPERLELGKSTLDGDWEIFSQDQFFPVSQVPEPKRSHMLEIIDTICFRGSTWPDAITNLEQACRRDSHS